MQFDRDEYVLLSRLGRVPQARSKGPPRYEPVADRKARAGQSRRPRRPRRLRAKALLGPLGAGRAAFGGNARNHRRER